MGAFLTNVQVKVVGSAARTRENVIDAIRDQAWQDGLTLLDGDAALTADRTVVIGGDDRWISVYDEATEDQDAEKLTRLATLLSRATGGAAVSVLVHDSDATYLELFFGGVHRDRWCNRPDWFGEMDDEAKAAWAGRPDAWSLVGVKPAAIAAAWKKKVPVFAEEYLAYVGSVLGWNGRYVSVGYRYLQQSMDDREDALVTLAFRDPKHASAMTPAEGPPRFDLAGASPAHADAPGQPIHLSVTARNTGGGGRGLHIEVAGSALDDGFIALDEVTLVTGRQVAATRALSIEASRLVVEVEDLDVQAGVGDWMSLMRTGRKGMEAVMLRDLSVQLRGRALAVGDGTVTVTVTPADNPDGACVTELDVRVGGERLMPRMPGTPRMTISEFMAAKKPKKAKAKAKPTPKRKPTPKPTPKRKPTPKPTPKPKPKPTPKPTPKPKPKPKSKRKATRR
jgi:hypothetical protein